jgi:hypothetical protein
VEWRSRMQLNYWKYYVGINIHLRTDIPISPKCSICQTIGLAEDPTVCLFKPRTTKAKLYDLIHSIVLASSTTMEQGRHIIAKTGVYSTFPTVLNTTRREKSFAGRLLLTRRSIIPSMRSSLAWDQLLVDTGLIPMFLTLIYSYTTPANSPSNKE